MRDHKKGKRGNGEVHRGKSFIGYGAGHPRKQIREAAAEVKLGHVEAVQKQSNAASPSDRLASEGRAL